MDTLKILIPYPTGHDTTSIRTILFNNLIPILKKRVNVRILRVVYQPEKIDKIPAETSDITTFDLRNYKNALEILKQEKPDVIYANPYPGFIDYAFSFAGKKLNIPVVAISIYSSRDISSFGFVKFYGRKLLSNSVEVEINKNKKSFMRRGKFIFYKFNFLLKTLLSAKLNFLEIIKKVFLIIDLIILRQPKYIDPRLAVSMHYLRNETQEQELLSVGFKPSTLLVTGHPMFDHSFQQSSLKKEKTRDSKIQILLIPDPLYEAGIWTKEQKDLILTQIVKEITKFKDDFFLKIKVHPSSGILSEYEPLVHLIDSSIPIFQEGSMEEYLNDTDVVIAYSLSSTGLIYSLIAKKPVVICNFFNESNGGSGEGLITDKLALECKNISSLIDTINNSLLHNSSFENNRKNYIRKYFYKDDGLASERICLNLLQLTKKNI